MALRVGVVTRGRDFGIFPVFRVFGVGIPGFRAPEGGSGVDFRDFGGFPGWERDRREEIGRRPVP